MTAPWLVYAVALACAVGIATGQLMFKTGADLLTRNGGVIVSQAGAIVLAAFALYGVTTLAWIWVLRHSDLGKIYPVMALAFVLVPVASHYLFGEQFSWRYAIGCALIVVGVVLTSQAA